MTRHVLPLMLMAATAFGQYTAKPGGEPPSELAPAVAEKLASPGTKIYSADGTEYCEIWLAKAAPSGPDLSEVDLSWNTVPHGSLMGAIRYPSLAHDRRGQQIQPGVYTLRFSFYPIDGAHQGVEPSRDFLLLSPAAGDTDAAATPDFATLVATSVGASGTAHPAGLSLWKADSDWQAGFSEMGEDWVLSTKIGDAQVSIIIAGVNAHDK